MARGVDKLGYFFGEYREKPALFADRLSERLGELIRAGGRPISAGDPFHAGDGVMHVHSDYKACNSLGIAVASSDKFYILNDTSVYVYSDQL